MCKFFAFTVILSSILIAHVVCPRPPETKKPAEPEVNQPAADVDDSDADETDTNNNVDDDDADQDEESASEDEVPEDDSDIEEEDEPSLPFLTCTIFQDNFACNAMCSVLGSIYGTPITSGVCEEAKECECQVLPKATLEDYWNAKFLAKNTLREILQDKELSEKILEVLKTPLKTAQQTIEDLKPHLSPKQLSNLRIKNKSAQKLFSNDGEFDKVAVQKYVASKLKSLGKPSEDFDYKKTLLDVLNSPDNDDIVDYIINEIRQSKNKLLNSAIESYVKEHDIPVQEPDTDSNDQDTIIDFLDTAVINELIKPPPRENAMKLTGLRSKSKKSAAGIENKPSNEPASIAKSINNRTNTSVDTVKNPSTVQASPTNTNKKGMQSSPGNNIKSNNESDPSASKSLATDDSRWTLEGFDKRVVDKLDKGTKQWDRPGFYSISLSKGCKAVGLIWNNQKDGITAEIYAYRNGEIEQRWSFENGRINITIKKCANSGSLTELWNFPSSRLYCTKGTDGKIINKKWTGPQDLQSLKKSEKFIDSWCAHNDFFVGKGNCNIY